MAGHLVRIERDPSRSLGSTAKLVMSKTDGELRVWVWWDGVVVMQAAQLAVHGLPPRGKTARHLERDERHLPRSH